MRLPYEILHYIDHRIQVLTVNIDTVIHSKPDETVTDEKRKEYRSNQLEFVKALKEDRKNLRSMLRSTPDLFKKFAAIEIEGLSGQITQLGDENCPWRSEDLKKSMEEKRDLLERFVKTL